MPRTTHPHAGQLSLFPTGRLMTRRKHHPNRGEQYRVWLGTVQWQHRRELAMERADYRCTDCGCEDRLVAHHTSYARVGDEWPEDLEALCPDCHDKRHERAA
jgi:5-methylcytosine-specific restriction endonuclease McrA